VLEILRNDCGLSPEWRIADIGSGTGFLTELFLRNGNPTFAIEPNKEMREAAETLLHSYPGFISIDGTAEDSTLGDYSVDMIAAGQAFHWFDRPKAKAEFSRILRPGGWVALMWNERRDDTPFLQAYEQLMCDFCPEYKTVDHKNVDCHALSEFFAPAGYLNRSCENVQAFDFEGLRGRLLSSSYAPLTGNERMLAELSRIFELHQSNGRVLLDYDTRIYLSQWP
jgi:SAM-dependent methyltransferase